MQRLLLASLLTTSAASPIANTCNASLPSQTWAYALATGYLTSLTSGLCLTASGDPSRDGTSLLMAACGSLPAPQQAFDLLPKGNFIVSRAAPTKCVNIEAYGTAPGSTVWLYGCMGPGYTCQGNCDWVQTNVTLLRNVESGLCLDDGYVPPMQPTCAAGAPSASLPFCNPALSNAARVADLTSRLSTELKLTLFSLPLPSVPFSQLTNLSLGLAAFYWDVTMIHGLSTTFFLDPLRSATCFPHSIGQAASWDVSLVGRIASAVAYEARVMNQLNFASSNGQAVQALMAEGGPLANSVHDPRVRLKKRPASCPLPLP